jgi:hypothetical protein
MYAFLRKRLLAIACCVMPALEGSIENGLLLFPVTIPAAEVHGLSADAAGHVEVVLPVADVHLPPLYSVGLYGLACLVKLLHELLFRKPFSLFYYGVLECFAV